MWCRKLFVCFWGRNLRQNESRRFDDVLSGRRVSLRRTVVYARVLH